MTTRLSALSAVLLATTASAQFTTPSNIVTRALEPAAEDLARLNLVSAWRVFLPVENRGDGIAAVQAIDDQVFAQLQSGVLVAIQADANPKTFKRAGDILWTFRPLQPPGVVRPLAVGKDEVYLTHGQNPGATLVEQKPIVDDGEVAFIRGHAS